MDFPSELRQEIESMISDKDIKALTSSAESLSQRYRSNDGSGKRMASTALDTAAYAAVRMPATFGAVSKALSLSLECVEEHSFATVLDVGSGTGAAVHAAAAASADCGRFTCIEREREMIALGKRLTDSAGISADWICADIADGLSHTAELVICSYCLNELGGAAAEKAAVERLWQSTEKLLLIVEPGTPEGFSRLLRAREQLLQLGAKIAAPCPETAVCPLSGSKGDWCHFTARVSRSRLHKRLKGGEVPYEDEKFCFLAAARALQEPSPCTGRILRHPQIDSGRITLELCTSSGIEQRIVTKKSPLFKQARKSSAGDSFNADR